MAIELVTAKANGSIPIKLETTTSIKTPVSTGQFLVIFAAAPCEMSLISEPTKLPTKLSTRVNASNKNPTESNKASKKRNLGKSPAIAAINCSSKSDDTKDKDA